jgi:type II secretory pathway component PulC
MDSFLSDTMRIINVITKNNEKETAKVFRDGILKEHVLVNNILELEKLFLKAMNRAQIIFEEHTFRKSYPGKRRTPINKALFEVWSSLLAKIDEEEFKNLQKNRDQFLEEYTSLLEDGNFNYAISRDSLKTSSVKERYEKLNNLLNKFII